MVFQVEVMYLTVFISRLTVLNKNLQIKLEFETVLKKCNHSTFVWTWKTMTGIKQTVNSKNFDTFFSGILYLNQWYKRKIFILLKEVVFGASTILPFRQIKDFGG